MHKVVLTLEQQLSQFEADHGPEARALREVIASSSELVFALEQANELGHLEGGFALLIVQGQVEEKKSGVNYDPELMCLFVLSTLLQAAQRDPHAVQLLCYALGREVQHAIHRSEIREANQRFFVGTSAITIDVSPHDHTPAVRQFLASTRQREALADMAGFNALAAHFQHTQPDATLAQWCRVLAEATPQTRVFVQAPNSPNALSEFILKPDLALGCGFQLDSTPETVEAVAQLGFDGRGGREATVSKALHFIEWREAHALAELLKNEPESVPPEIHIQLHALNVRLNKVRLPAGMRDISSGGPMVAVGALSTSAQALLADAERLVRETTERNALHWDQGMRNTVASVAVAARMAGLTGINRLSASHGEIRLGQDDGIHTREAQLSARLAANTPVNSSFALLADASIDRLLNEPDGEDSTLQALEITMLGPQAWDQMVATPITLSRH
ncbi:hypothetical protein [Hydrogenophaga sp. PAMC20947]|uniref:hypothetical protein n=1 Tax=Hydrogenophaga sp. PAMC20947 TaxID=2565558 RepID=UPI00109E19C5|nr:hypothetical protein [Hydrogenophaga sp. PAMC20947]QCB47932.1 hypothetical protein E5678_18980 [Hydrogenophaga sp. PAMC20947]